METHLLAVGRLRPSFREACDDYLGRLARYGPVREREVKEAGRAGNATVRRREEGRRLGALIPPRAVVVALDRNGTPWSSEELARRLEAWRVGVAPLALLIGGAFGLDPELLGGSRHRWSLGPLTLPHELARVVVLEQWYRAWTILRGEAYHKGT